MSMETDWIETKILCGLLLIYAVILLYLVKTMLGSPLLPFTAVLLSIFFAFLTLVIFAASENNRLVG